MRSCEAFLIIPIRSTQYVPIHPSDCLPIQKTDSISKILRLFEDIKNKDVQDIVILSGDHLYRMDYMAFVDRHREVDADITIGCLPMDDERASDFGLMKIDDTGRIIEFAEKPEGDALKAMQVDTTVLGLDAEAAAANPYIASMGIYVFKKTALVSFLNSEYPQDNDFGGEIIPKAAQDGYKVQVRTPRHKIMLALYCLFVTSVSSFS